MGFQLDQFIADCSNAVRQDASHAHLREVVARAVSDSAAVLRMLGEPIRAEMQCLFRSNELTLLNVIWAPRMTLLPHNHQMVAVIGIYTGREDNIFWRRVPGGESGRLEAVGAKALGEKETLPLGRDVVHSVINPISRLTGAIHVYTGDYFGVPRSEWDPETLLEGPSDGEKMQHRFDEANALLSRTKTGA